MAHIWKGFRNNNNNNNNKITTTTTTLKTEKKYNRKIKQKGVSTDYSLVITILPHPNITRPSPKAEAVLRFSIFF